MYSNGLYKYKWKTWDCIFGDIPRSRCVCRGTPSQGCKVWPELSPLLTACHHFNRKPGRKVGTTEVFWTLQESKGKKHWA